MAENTSAREVGHQHHALAVSRPIGARVYSPRSRCQNIKIVFFCKTMIVGIKNGCPGRRNRRPGCPGGGVRSNYSIVSVSMLAAMLHVLAYPVLATGQWRVGLANRHS